MPFAPPPAPPVTAPAARPAPSPVRYGFREAEIGMDLAGWRASAPRRRDAACTAAKGGTLVCRTPDQALGGGYRVRRITSTFVDGRLAQVSFATSIDGFAFVTAELKQRFGAPGEVRRDRVKLSNGLDLPHLLMTWRNGRSTIRLSDPERPGGRLGVTIASDAYIAGTADDRSRSS